MRRIGKIQKVSTTIKLRGEPNFAEDRKNTEKYQQRYLKSIIVKTIGFDGRRM